MKKNELLKIADQDFLLSPVAAKVINQYLDSIKKRYRLRPSARRSLEEALRDVLMSYETKRSTAITKPKAVKAISIVGSRYENTGLFGVLVSKLKPVLLLGVAWLIRTGLRRRVQVVLFLVLALAFTSLAVSLITSAFDKDWWQNYSQPTSTSIETTIGYVRSTYWAAIPEMPGYPGQRAQNIAGAVACMLFALLFVMLVGRTKRKYPVLALAVISVITWGFLAYDTQQDRNSYVQSIQTSTFSTVDTVRTTEDLDYLQVCGTEINYVIGAQSGRLFYDFYDQGYRLAKGLENVSKFGEPNRADICMAYDELRRTYSDKDIVLQMYIKDINGVVRPFDFDERFIAANGDKLRYQALYGFFVKK